MNKSDEHWECKCMTNNIHLKLHHRECFNCNIDRWEGEDVDIKSLRIPELMCRSCYKIRNK